MPDKGTLIKTFDSITIDDLPEVATQIIAMGKDFPIWSFEGEMGAGKTTLIKQIGAELGIVDEVNSPTFSLVNEYMDDQDETYYHFDFYRLKSEAEASDIGVEEYFDSGNYCFVEWAEKIPTLIPENILRIFILPRDHSSRKIVLETV